MRFLLALLPEAQADCVAAPPRWLWPPSGAEIPSQPELTVTGAYAEGLWLLALDHEPVALEVVWSSPMQSVLRPVRPLPEGPVALMGHEQTVRWTVVDRARPAPRWRAEPRVRSVWGVDMLCPEGPVVTAEIPLVGEQRQPLVEVSAKQLDGTLFRRRFLLEDGQLTLYDGCEPPFPMPGGALFSLALVGIDEGGQVSEPRVLPLRVVDTPVELPARP